MGNGDTTECRVGLGVTAGFLGGLILGLPLLSLESSTSPSHPSNP